jgi:hypothetical protein
MSVIMTLQVTGDPKALEQFTSENTEKMQAVLEAAKRHGLIARPAELRVVLPRAGVGDRADVRKRRRDLTARAEILARTRDSRRLRLGRLIHIGLRDIPELNVSVGGWRPVRDADSGQRRLTLFPNVVC